MILRMKKYTNRKQPWEKFSNCFLLDLLYDVDIFLEKDSYVRKKLKSAQNYFRGEIKFAGPLFIHIY